MLCFIFILFLGNFSYRTSTTYHLSTIPSMTASIEETNKTMHEFFQFQERNDWVLILILLGLGALICVPIIMFCQKRKSKGKLLTIKS